MRFATSILLLLSVTTNHQHLFAEAVEKTQNPFDAYNTNINQCFLNQWKYATLRLLSGSAACGKDRKGLCYGIKPQQALFVVCYNKITLIPEFTAHIIEPVDKRGGADARIWRNEQGANAPFPQSDFSKDYPQPGFQEEKLNRFYSRGHLTPNADFITAEGRELTMVNTNIAPQWQQFNGGNWAILEDAVRKYADNNKRAVFVFTGTAGSYERTINGVAGQLKLNGKVFIPKYYWKAICDPVIQKSVVFLAKNPTGVEPDVMEGGCHLQGKDGKPIPTKDGKPKRQSVYKGVIFCYSLKSAKESKEGQLFNLPPFADMCKPEERGTFLDEYLFTGLE